MQSLHAIFPLSAIVKNSDSKPIHIYRSIMVMFELLFCSLLQISIFQGRYSQICQYIKVKGFCRENLAFEDIL